MNTPNDGGAAFPSPGVVMHESTDRGLQEYQQGAYAGMSLRDYFAVHCDQPGEAEICAAAGFIWDNGVLVDEKQERQSFHTWWRATPQERRFELYAQVRYAMADAMLKARS